MDKINLITFTFTKNQPKIDVDTITPRLEPYIQSNDDKLQPYFAGLKSLIPDKYGNKKIIVTFELHNLTKKAPMCKTTIKYTNSLKKYLAQYCESIVGNVNDILANTFMVAVNAYDALQTQNPDE